MKLKRFSGNENLRFYKFLKITEIFHPLSTSHSIILAIFFYFLYFIFFLFQSRQSWTHNSSSKCFMLHKVFPLSLSSEMKNCIEDMVIHIININVRTLYTSQSLSKGDKLSCKESFLQFREV